MTLSLDDVRNKRFRMARKSGYEVLEVDEFVDEVEEAFAQLVEENQNLKKQVEALKSSAPTAESAPAAAAESARPTEATQPAQAVAAQAAPRQAAPAPTQQPAASPEVAAEKIVVTTAHEASSAVVRLVQLSTEQAERLVAEATDDANRIREEANRTAHQLTTDARTRAERVESEAQLNADRVRTDADNRSQQLSQEIESRRTELFGDLEKQRDELTATVSALREFESAYRTNLTTHLRSQIETLESGHAEPADPPAALSTPVQRPAAEPSGAASGQGGAAPEQADGADRGDEPKAAGDAAPTSDTPRLDALLGEQH